MASTVLEFAAQPSDSLPALIASFAHPVYVDSDVLFEPDLDVIATRKSEVEEIGAVVAAPEVPSRPSPTSEAGQLGEWADPV